MELLYTGIIGVARCMFKVQGLDITVYGDRNIPESGGAVLVINHTGYLDPVYAGIGPRVHKRFVRYMAKVEAFENRWTGPLFRKLNHIPVDRTSGTDAFEKGVRWLRDGELVGVFPEATISRSFEIKQFKTGAVRMAAAAEVPLIPITIWGSQRVVTKGLPKNLLRPKVPIMIDVGAPMRIQDPSTDVTEELRERMRATLETLQRRYAEAYGPYPEGADWVPRGLGGGAPTLEEANALDEAEHQERLRRKAAASGGGE